MSRISVILTHFQTPEYLVRSVKSILAQGYRDFTLYVLDDSTPSSDWHQSLQKAVTDPRLQVYTSDRNVGTYRLKNAMLERVDSEYVAFQDADDWSLPDRLEKQVAYFADAGTSLVGASYYELRNETSLHPTIMPERPSLPAADAVEYLSLHPTWIFKRDLLDKLVGFDGETRIAADDEFLYRALFVTKVVNANDYLYVKRQHPRSLTEEPNTGFGSKLRRDYARSICTRLKALRIMPPEERELALRGRRNNLTFSLSRLS